MGIDFVIDQDKKPYLIEINSYPDLFWRDDKTNYSIKKQMLEDFLSFFVYPKLDITPKRDAKELNWTLCNPLYHTHDGQYQLMINLENNLFKNGDKIPYDQNNKLLCLRYWQDEYRQCIVSMDSVFGKIMMSNSRLNEATYRHIRWI